MARLPRVLVLLRFFVIVSAWVDIFNLNIGINLKNKTGNLIRSLMFGAPSDSHARTQVTQSSFSAIGNSLGDSVEII